LTDQNEGKNENSDPILSKKIQMLKVQNENINDPNLFKVFRVTKFIE
jgi:hypothetical protein